MRLEALEIGRLVIKIDAKLGRCTDSCYRHAQCTTGSGDNTVIRNCVQIIRHDYI